jgi:hypothetical protein
MTKTTYPIPSGCTGVTIEQEGEVVIVKFETERWRAELGEDYWMVSAHNEVDSFVDEDDRYDRMNYNSGNYFRTREEAEAELERRKKQ